MDNLTKAVTQNTLTSDTVDAQFCSDWLKGQVHSLFTQLAQKDALIAKLQKVVDAARESIRDEYEPVSGKEIKAALAELDKTSADKKP